jgi:hypothetical protein
MVDRSANNMMHPQRNKGGVKFKMMMSERKPAPTPKQFREGEY